HIGKEEKQLTGWIYSLCVVLFVRGMCRLSASAARSSVTVSTQQSCSSSAFLSLGKTDCSCLPDKQRFRIAGSGEKTL
ncbi:hypothetical protein, partial [Flavonifractor plautii]|uniref:hypothetical protein n=1 Tax=Flavonifractor plautii TaxID=292800 RepID=UPI003D7E6709